MAAGGWGKAKLDAKTLNLILDASKKPADDAPVAAKFGISKHTVRYIRTGHYFKLLKSTARIEQVCKPTTREKPTVDGATVTHWVAQLRQNIEPSGNLGKLDEGTIKRIVPKVAGCIFDKKCTFWKGAVSSRKRKGDLHGRFGFPGTRKGKSVLITRLLYHNFVGHLDPNDNVLHRCNTEGICTSLGCLYKGNMKQNQDDCTRMGNRLPENLGKRLISNEQVETIRNS